MLHHHVPYMKDLPNHDLITADCLKARAPAKFTHVRGFYLIPTFIVKCGKRRNEHIICQHFSIKIKFSVSTLHEILDLKKVKGSASKANKDCQILLFDVHVVHGTPKVTFPRRIGEDDGKQAVSTLHSNVQLLFSLIKAIVLCRSRRRCRPRISKSLIRTHKHVEENR